MGLCSNCGKENADDARFCAACGTLLADATAPPETRKTVTVVFCDLAGSTSMGERLDPESVRGVMSKYYAEMRSALERHGGTVEKFIGDAVMAVFGIPTLHEDDALRAVRAAADMRHALSALNDDLEREWGVRLQVRTGVNTGRVVTGDPALGQAFVVGDAVNVAARLEQNAQSGEILVGPETYRLVRDAITAEPVQPLELKGKADPFPAFRLLEASAGNRSLDRRADSPLVGRERELRALDRTFARAALERRCQLCTLVGTAGLGKSRLTREFVASLGNRARILTGRCLPYGEGITYWPIAEVVRQAAGLVQDESADEARSKIAALLTTQDDGAQILARVAPALGLSTGASSPEVILWGVRRLLEALAEELPLVIVFDDIQWGEATFLDLIEHLAQRIEQVPVLLLCLARPELLERRPGFGQDVESHTSIVLEPLAASESHKLITNLVGEGTLADELAERVTQHASGNPLFVGEVIRMLADEGLLEAENGGSRAEGHVAALDVPPTIEALLSARLDSLIEEERLMLERGSVIGEEFWTGALLRLSPETEPGAAVRHLDCLLDKKLIRPHPTVFKDEEAYGFAHILLRDVAYGRLLKQARAKLHERFADWLAQKVGQRLVEFEEIIGYHLEQSYLYRGELGTISESTRAVGVRGAEHLASAGRRAFARGDICAAANLLTRACSLLPELDRSRVQMQPELAEALMELGELERADQLLAQTIEAAARQGDQGLECRSEITRLSLQLIVDPAGKVERASAVLERAIPILERLNEERALARAWSLRAQLHLMAMRLGELESACERGVEYARRAGDEFARAEIQALQTMAAWMGPTPVATAAVEMQTLLEQAGEDPRLKSFIFAALAGLNAMAGDFEQARRFASLARATCEEFGWELLLAAGASQVDGHVELAAGDPAAAECAMRPGYEALVEMGEKSYLSTVAAMIAEALHRQGRDDEAEQFSIVSEQSAAAEDVASQVGWRGTRAKLLARRGQQVEAEPLAREALELALSTDSPTTQADALMDLAEVLSRADRGAEVASLVDEAIELYEAKGDVTSADRARTLRARVGAV